MNQTPLDIAATPYANQHGYSDVNPFEVVRQVSARTLEVRALHAERAAWTPVLHLGGFAAHIANQRDQRWTITVNPDAPVVRIRLGKHGWRDRFGQRFILHATAIKFFDFNY